MNEEIKLPEENNKKKKKPFFIILFIFFIIVALVSAAFLVLNLIPQKPKETTPDVPLTPLQSTVEKVENPVDFRAKKLENPDIVGWIKIPDTVIDYPVMQSAEDEAEDFYIDHNPQKSEYRAGSIYMQKINSSDFKNPNTVLYGHNMANGSMFHAIRSYRNKDFFTAHPYVYVYTPGHILTYEVYSAFLYDDRHILNSFNFYNEKSFTEYIEMTKNPHSMTKQVKSETQVTASDRILTLSTCASQPNERFIVEGVLINDQLTTY